MFFKKEVANDSFNNMVILAIAETLRACNRLPTEVEMFTTIEKLLKANNVKLSQQQRSAVELCAMEFNMFSWAESELIPEYKKFFLEFPKDLTSYRKIGQILCSHGLIWESW